MKEHKQYEHNGIKFNVDGHRWIFIGPNFILRHPCKGGNSIARKVAGAVSGALKRTANVGLDQLARGQIKKITGF